MKASYAEREGEGESECVFRAAGNRIYPKRSYRHKMGLRGKPESRV